MEKTTFDRIFDIGEHTSINKVKLWKEVSQPILVEDICHSKDNINPFTPTMLPEAGKRSRNATNFKNRFFILKGSTLYYAKDSNPKTKIRALVDLQFCYISYQTIHAGLDEYTLSLERGSHFTLFYIKGKGRLDVWLE